MLRWVLLGSRTLLDFCYTSISSLLVYINSLLCHNKTRSLCWSVMFVMVSRALIWWAPLRFVTMTDPQTPSLHSYLYLYHSKNVAISLVSPLLDPNNYHVWSRSMLTALSAKNKLEFVTRTAPQPPISNPLHHASKRCNNIVVSWILHFVSEQIRHRILWMDNAEDIWLDLKSQYAQAYLLCIFELQYEASSLKQGDLFITNFFTKLYILWDEMEN